MTVVFIFIVIVIVVIVKGCDRNLILGRKEEKKKINFSFSETVIAMVKNFFFPLYLYSTHVFYLTLILELNILLLKCGTLILRHQQGKNNPQGTHGVYFLLIC